jgi:RimJ/RimL family protein N-acetyltransferase
MKTHPAILHTPRLTLRPFRASDRELLRRLLEGLDLQALFETGGRRLTAPRMAAALIRDAVTKTTHAAPIRLSLAIVPRGARTAIGGALLDCDAEGSGDIGLWLSPANRNRGLGSEALAALLRHGFDSLGLTTICGICTPANAASIRMMEGCGMRFQHRLTSEDQRGSVVERAAYTITREFLQDRHQRQQAKPAQPDISHPSFRASPDPGK